MRCEQIARISINQWRSHTANTPADANYMWFVYSAKKSPVAKKVRKLYLLFFSLFDAYKCAVFDLLMQYLW